MFNKIMKNIFGSGNDRILKRYQSFVEQINSLENEIKSLSDKDLKNKTDYFKQLLSKGQSIDDLLVEAFAVVREASVRTIGLRHFDVQLIGGMVLHEGKIAEMKTGEGKTLVATLSAYLNALSGKGVHIVTVNDYLAKRDAKWMSPIYDFLGFSVGIIQHDMSSDKRRESYLSDVIYGTNNEFGFDYLRDNMAEHSSIKVQREHHFCIVDEVDSILIDEARTPLIISGATEESTELYYRIDKIIPKLKPAKKGSDEKWIHQTGDYQFEEKDRNVVLSEQGISKVEKFLGVDNLYGAHNVNLVHYVNQALKAHIVFKKDVDYIIEQGQVIIIDEHTGRKMHGRRYSDGLHQSLEAKENVAIEQETQTLASITFQNYFRMYDKLSGMTGTAETEAEEFYKIYKLNVVVIPTNLPMKRNDNADRIYRTEKEKFTAILNEIQDCYKKGQPVLVGTISIEKSEKLSQMLKRKNISHNLLNAKFHDREALVVSQGGQKSVVTIATNMAGRGTDIKLGKGVLECGGLHIIGTERHEARRIDNQLRGRSGRQGDPGSSRFYLSLEDDLMRLFGSDRISNLMRRMGMDEGQEIEHPWITKAIANAQKKVEGRNFEIRKFLLEYDDVMNRQRQYIYNFRNKILLGDNLKEILFDVIQNFIKIIVSDLSEGNKQISFNELKNLSNFYKNTFNINIVEKSYENIPCRKDELIDFLSKKMIKAYEFRENEIGVDQIRELESFILLHTIDSKWKDHLYAMDSLKEGIHLRAYAERNPLTEYKLEGSSMFENLKYNISESVLEFLFKVKINDQVLPDDFSKNIQFSKHEIIHEAVQPFTNISNNINKEKGQESVLKGNRLKGNISTMIPKKGVKIGRNQQCPCSSGRKYKQCCGR